MRKATQQQDILILTTRISPPRLHSAIFITVVCGVLLARFAGKSLNPLDWPFPPV